MTPKIVSNSIHCVCLLFRRLPPKKKHLQTHHIIKKSQQTDRIYSQNAIDVKYISLISSIATGNKQFFHLLCGICLFPLFHEGSCRSIRSACIVLKALFSRSNWLQFAFRYIQCCYLLSIGCGGCFCLYFRSLLLLLVF